MPFHAIKTPATVTPRQALFGKVL